MDIACLCSNSSGHYFCIVTVSMNLLCTLFSRFITVMYFLSDADGGELVLPLADNKTYFWGVSCYSDYD